MPTARSHPVPETRSWQTLIGEGWPAYVRVLHPASRRIDGVECLVRWREIAPDGVAVATAGWFEVSGVALHDGVTGQGWEHEPGTGPDPLALPVLLHHLLAHLPDGRLWVGEWDGWDGRKPPAGSRVVKLPGRRYHVTATSQRDLLTNLDPDRLPDVIWDEEKSFVVLADIDLPSTIVGCDPSTARHIVEDPALEAVLVDADAPVVA